jgi:hypothetical protein
MVATGWEQRTRKAFFLRESGSSMCVQAFPRRKTLLHLDHEPDSQTGDNHKWNHPSNMYSYVNWTFGLIDMLFLPLHDYGFTMGNMVVLQSGT